VIAVDYQQLRHRNKRRSFIPLLEGMRAPREQSPRKRDNVLFTIGKCRPWTRQGAVE